MQFIKSLSEYPVLFLQPLSGEHYFHDSGFFCIFLVNNLFKQPGNMKLKIYMKRVVLMSSILAIVFLFLNADLSARDTEDVILGKRIALNSKILNEERKVMVYLPDMYNTEGNKYPVLYLLDGEAHFLHASGIVQYLSRLGYIPQMIVVAIENIDRTRDFSPTHVEEFPTSGGAEKFAGFLERELIPYIDKNFHAAPFRVLMGHSFGGTFAVHSLLTQPGLFNAYLALSPYLHYNDSYVINQAEKKLKSVYPEQKFFFMTVGNEETYFEPLKRFSELLKEKSGKSIRFQYTIMNDENHGSIPHLSIYNGLKFIFADWPIAQYIISGGLEPVDNHYKKLSELYGYELKAPEFTINLAGYAMLQRGETDRAIEIFRENVKRYPHSANVYDSLGEAYEKNNQHDLAIKNYLKACERGQQINDPNTETYCRNLKRLMEIP